MAETIDRTHPEAAGGKWLWHDVMNDLATQGGLKVTIDPLSVQGNTCGGEIDDTGKPFVMSWIYDQCLFVSMELIDPRLIDAFSAVVEYKPFCKYRKGKLVTYVWWNGDQIGYFKELQADSKISDLEKL